MKDGAFSKLRLILILNHSHFLALLLEHTMQLFRVAMKSLPASGLLFSTKSQCMKQILFLIIFLTFYSFSSCCDKQEENPTECELNCALEPDPGCLGTGTIAKYYFDKTEKKCKVFIWGGCDGVGVVPFETLQECESCGCN